MANSHPSTLTLRARAKDQRLFSGRRLEQVNKGFNPEYSSQQKYGPIANGVGENPLNGKGVDPNVKSWV